MRVVLWWVALALVCAVWVGWSWVMAQGFKLHKAMEALTERTERQLLQAQATSRKGLK